MVNHHDGFLHFKIVNLPVICFESQFDRHKDGLWAEGVIFEI